MDTGQVLLRQVLESPDDDAPKLVYADWLEEQGDRLAELIRVHCARRDPDPSLVDALEPRLAPLAEWTTSPCFEAGMIARIHVKTGKYAQRATQSLLLPLLSRFGLVRTHLHGAGIKVPSCATLAWTTELWWFDCQAGAPELEAFAASPHVTRLHTLVLEKTRTTNAGLQALARSPNLSRVRTFGLLSPVHGGDHDAHGILDIVERLPITSLDLGGNWNKLHIDALDAPPLAKLTTFAITTSRCGELARSRHLSNLTRLRLSSYTNKNDEDVLALLDNPTFAKLERLDLRMGPLTERVLDRVRARFGEAWSHRAYGF